MTSTPMTSTTETEIADALDAADAALEHLREVWQAAYGFGVATFDAAEELARMRDSHELALGADIAADRAHN